MYAEKTDYDEIKAALTEGNRLLGGILEQLSKLK